MRRLPRMATLYDALSLFLSILKFFILAHFIMSWLINFQVLNIRQPTIQQIWYGLNSLLAPIYEPIRRIMPRTGNIDLSPMVALFLVYILQRALIHNQGFFYGY
jgi:YggT family protein